MRGRVVGGGGLLALVSASPLALGLCLSACRTSTRGIPLLLLLYASAGLGLATAALSCISQLSGYLISSGEGEGRGSEGKGGGVDADKRDHALEPWL